jgi:uncharacterized protein YbjT (DUF2867 family)
MREFLAFVEEMNMQNDNIVIIGGMGKTGGRVAERLKGRGVLVRAASRSTTPAFDWVDRNTRAAALSGATSAYVTYQPDLAVPRAADDIAAFAVAAQQAGVEHIVLLSGRGEDGAIASEERLQASGINYTVLRASWFDQNFSEGLFLEGILAGQLVLPADAVREPFVDLDDVADAAVAALLDPAHRNRVYELTGPRLMTFAEAVAEIASASGRQITYATAPIDGFVAELRAAGLPEELLWLMDELFTRTLDGRNESVVGDLAGLIGRKPKDFSVFARDMARSNIWS